MRTLLNFFKAWFWNILTLLFNIIIWRDRNIWIFGAWMGDKFSDNSRYLFQYIDANKELYGIKDVIWVSRKPQVVEEVKTMGYKAYLIGSAKSFYYHLRAGVHVVCDNVSSTIYPYDLDTKFSFGAKKLQLWHGVGIKACGKLTRKNKKVTIKDRINDSVIEPYGLPGVWGNCYFLATSKENERVAIEDLGIKPCRIIIGSYPRLLKCYKYKSFEEEVISKIRTERKRGKKIILYLPTFRSKKSQYIHPRNINGFDSFLVNENLLWIEKYHSAAVDKQSINNSDNILGLSPEFDVNVLYEFIDLLITDYSSASSDALYWNKTTLEYCPDFEEYKSNDRGFVAPFELYHLDPNPVIEANLLLDAIHQRLQQLDLFNIQMKRVRIFLFGDCDYGYDMTLKRIKEKMKI